MLRALRLIVLVVATLLLSGCAQPPTAPSAPQVPIEAVAPEVVEAEHAWGAVTAEHTQVLTGLTLRNPNRIDVPVRDLRYTIVGGSVVLGEGEVRAPFVLPAGGQATLPLVTEVANGAVAAWWAQHVAAGERSTVRVVGQASFGAGPLGIPFPFERAREVNTSLLDFLQGFGTCEAGLDVAPCLEDSTHAWQGASANHTALASQLVVRNPLPVPLDGEAATIALVLSGVEVARGASAPFQIPAGGTGTVNATSVLLHDAVQQWWPRHLAACEESPVQLRVGLRALGGEVALATPPLGNLTTHIAC